MFIDEVKIYVKGGDGGKGCNSMYRDKINRRGRPDGGPGGDGGDIIFEASPNVQTLLDFQYRQHFTAESGAHGSSNHKKGKRGPSLHVKLPAGTTIKDCENGLVLRDLVNIGDSVKVARGGEGGHGNSRHREASDGNKGEEKRLLLELRLIADVGIIGYPNAGKSTLISRISSAKPKIANYPFTTKEPVLGVVKLSDEAIFVAAEIPGLIKGAHEGRGLGDKFLRHVERTKILIHLVDASAFEGREPVDDYVNLNKELKLYSKELAKKHQIIALNKIDITGAKDNVKKFKKFLGKKKFFAVSGATGEGVKELLKAAYEKIQKNSHKNRN